MARHPTQSELDKAGYETNPRGPDWARWNHIRPTLSLEPDRMHGLAWLGLALVARHRGVTKEKTLRNLVKR
jgi:hypothetical protein